METAVAIVLIVTGAVALMWDDGATQKEQTQVVCVMARCDVEVQDAE